MALSIAKRLELILDLRQSLNLTMLAAKSKKPTFDPMAVRWIKVVDDKGKLKLGELRWLAQRFEALRQGNGDAAKELERFLERGWR